MTISGKKKKKTNPGATVKIKTTHTHRFRLTEACLPQAP